MKNIFLFTVVLFCIKVNAQNVGIGTNTPHPSAALEVSASKKGLLLPRLTTIQRDSIVAPAVGLTILNLDDQCLDVYNGNNWSKNCGWRISGMDTLPGNIWVRRNDFPGPGRYGAVSFVLNGKGYVATGYDSVNNKYLKDLWEFDPVTYNWTQKASFPGVARKNAVAFTIGTKAYISTGVDSAGKLYKDLYEYDPAIDLWVQKANFMGSARQEAAAFTIGNYGYICTGLDSNGVNKETYRYDPVNNIWQQMASILIPDAGLYKGIAIGGNNHAYFFGGLRNTIHDPLYYNNHIRKYDALNNSWGASGMLLTGNVIDISSFAIGSRIYFVNGRGLSTPPNFFYYFDSTKPYSLWDNHQPAKEYIGNPTIEGVAFSIGNKGYVLSGRYTSGKEFYEFTTEAGNVIIPKYTNTVIPPINSFASDGNWGKLNKDIFSLNAGNIGLGTSSPPSKLSVVGGITIDNNDQNSGTVTNSLQFGSAGTGEAILSKRTAGGNQNGLDFLTANQSRLSIANNGNIGIGNSNPRAPLSLANTTANKKLALYDIGNNHQFYGFGVTNNTFRYQVSGTMDDHVFYAGIDSTTSNELFRIKGNGNVGIGTTNPSSKLSVAGGISIDENNQNNGTITNSLQFSGPGTGEAILSKRTAGGNQHGLDFLTNHQSRLSIANNGNIGIGNSSPSAPLSFANTTANKKLVLYDGGGNDHQFYGFGVTNNTFRYQVPALLDDHVFFAGLNNSISLELFRVKGNGSAILQGALIQVSDTRLKKNILPLQNSLQRIQKIKGYSYNWIDKNRDDKTQIGFLAQEVQAQFPELTTEIKQENGDVNLGVNYIGMIPILLEAIKEQQAQIEELKKKLENAGIK